MTHLSIQAAELLTREETARRLRVSLPTIDNWRKAGDGPTPTRIGGRVFYLASEIDRFLVDRTQRGKSEMLLDRTATMAGIVESELADRSDAEGPLRNAMLEATAGLAQAVRKVDLNIRRGDFTEAEARRFVSALDSLMRALDLLGGPGALEDTLAEDVAMGALQTAGALFPHLLPRALEP